MSLSETGGLESQVNVWHIIISATAERSALEIRVYRTSCDERLYIT